MPSWLLPWRHSPQSVSQDLLAGFIVAILIIPQAVGYGLLAHLPSSVALASCIFPLIAYGLLGRSHALAIGPVAIISLMVGDALQDIPANDVISAAQLLALEIALMLGLMRLLKLGNIVHFIGHPVIHGFTTAAALLIISKQIPLMLGTSYENISQLSLESIGLAIFAICTLLVIQKIPHKIFSKLGPLIVILFSALFVLIQPNTLSTIQITQTIQLLNIQLDLPWQYFSTLLPSALLIALIGFLESISVAKTIAKHNKSIVHINQELAGLSAANFASALFHGYPVAGGFGRTMVNHQAGASSPFAGMISALFVGLFLLFASEFLGYIPLAALGAIVTLAVWPLLDFAPAIQHWHSQPKENTIWLITFIFVLWIGVEMGILAGVITSIFFLLQSAAKPHMAIIGRIPGTAHFRNIKRHNVITHQSLLAIRIDEGLHFANSDAINDFIEAAVSKFPQAKHLLIVCSAVNILDGDGLELLLNWQEKLSAQGKLLHLAEVKGPIMDILKLRGFLDQLKPGQIFLSTHDAFTALSQPTSNQSA